MLEFLMTNPAFALLKKDHDTVKDLFDRFENAEGRPAKKKIVEQALAKLKVHATIEEEIFYPAVRKPVGKDTMNEADEEHHVAKTLIAELEEMDGRETHYDAKFTVLAKNVRPPHQGRRERGIPESERRQHRFRIIGPDDDGAQGNVTGQGRSSSGGGCDGGRQPW